MLGQNSVQRCQDWSSWSQKQSHELTWSRNSQIWGRSCKSHRDCQGWSYWGNSSIQWIRILENLCSWKPQALKTSRGGTKIIFGYWMIVWEIEIEITIVCFANLVLNKKVILCLVFDFSRKKSFYQYSRPCKDKERSNSWDILKSQQTKKTSSLFASINLLQGFPAWFEYF